MSKVSITNKLINICMYLYQDKFPTTPHPWKIQPYAYAGNYERVWSETTF